MTHRIIPINGAALLLREMKNLKPVPVIEWSSEFVEALIEQGEKRATKRLVAVRQEDITEKRPVIKRERAEQN